MRIAMIGGGYVGLVSGACFADFGIDVALVETDARKLTDLRDGKMPIYEPGLNSLVAENVAAGRLLFGNDLNEAVAGAEAVFIAVGTPTRRGDGHADLSYVYAAVEQVAAALTDYAVIVTKSTVPVGTGRRIAEIIRQVRPDAQFDIASNPEFLREGSAISDFKRPDRVIIGTESERAQEVMRRIYRPLYLIEAPIVFTGLETAELTKYAANAYLAMKVTFINEIADICERVGADVHDVARGIGVRRGSQNEAVRGDQARELTRELVRIRRGGHVRDDGRVERAVAHLERVRERTHHDSAGRTLRSGARAGRIPIVRVHAARAELEQALQHSAVHVPDEEHAAAADVRLGVRGKDVAQVGGRSLAQGRRIMLLFGLRRKSRVTTPRRARAPRVVPRVARSSPGSPRCGDP